MLMNWYGVKLSGEDLNLQNAIHVAHLFNCIYVLAKLHFLSHIFLNPKLTYLILKTVKFVFQ